MIYFIGEQQQSKVNIIINQRKADVSNNAVICENIDNNYIIDAAFPHN